MSHYCRVKDFYTERLQGNVLGVALLDSSSKSLNPFQRLFLSKYAFSAVYLDQVFCMLTGTESSLLHRTPTLGSYQKCHYLLLYNIS